MALSKDERAAIRHDMLRDPATPAHVREKLLHEDRMESEGRRNRRRDGESPLQARVNGWYSVNAPGVSPPDVGRLVGDGRRSDDDFFDDYCCDRQVAVFRAVAGVVFRECCGESAFRCVCESSVKSPFEA